MSAVTNGLERGEEFVYEFRLWLGREILFYIPASAVNAIVIPVAARAVASHAGPALSLVLPRASVRGPTSRCPRVPSNPRFLVLQVCVLGGSCPMDRADVSRRP